MQYDVPAHVQNEHHIQNQIQVIGGSNWDLSRGAITTPLGPYIPPIPDGYKPAHQVPSQVPDVVVGFESNSILLSKQVLKQLSGIPAKSKVVVVGHSSSFEKNDGSLSQRRADAVASQLKRRGHFIIEVKSFGSQVPKTLEEGDFENNQRVDLFIVK